jgi:prepilin peptidase dependent protein B
MLMKRRRGQRGFSIVEMMVGTAVGLIVTAGGIVIYVSNLTSTRTLLVETRVNQELRAAADLVARDMRRAGYWPYAIESTITTGTGTTTTANPYAAVSAATNEVTYGFSTDPSAASDDEKNTLAAGEQFGFRLNGNVVEMYKDSAWQAITHSNVVQITSFTITPTVTSTNLADLCSSGCSAAGCPAVTVRRYAVSLVGQATGNTAITRRLDSIVRMRNEQLSGACSS